MSRVSASLIRRNAAACETASREKCVCACGGAFHGRKHADEWIDEMIRIFGFDDSAQTELPFDDDDDSKAPPA